METLKELFKEKLAFLQNWLGSKYLIVPLVLIIISLAVCVLECMIENEKIQDLIRENERRWNFEMLDLSHERFLAISDSHHKLFDRHLED